MKFPPFKIEVGSWKDERRLLLPLSCGSFPLVGYSLLMDDPPSPRSYGVINLPPRSSCVPSVRRAKPIYGRFRFSFENRPARITVPKVEFQESAPCSGFDGSVMPPFLMVPFKGQNTADAVITPAAAATSIGFESSAPTIVTVTPATASTSPQTITVKSLTQGQPEIRAKIVGTTSICAVLGVDIKDKITKTVTIHAITEENDDVQVFAVGKGSPNEDCITAGPNKKLDTVAGGDDIVKGKTITTGVDGICNTTAAGDDVQVIAVGRGIPNIVCVKAGKNKFRDTAAAAGDDVIVGDNIDSGPDGICNTTANNVNLVPTNVPTAAALETYLNDVVWGKQANVFFKVKRKDEAVNYDLDRNGVLKDFTVATDEIDAISDQAQSFFADGNIYYIASMQIPSAFTLIPRKETWIQDAHANSALNITAHEIGHILGISGSAHSPNPKDLMHTFSLPTNPCNVRRVDWNIVNP